MAMKGREERPCRRTSGWMIKCCLWSFSRHWTHSARMQTPLKGPGGTFRFQVFLTVCSSLMMNPGGRGESDDLCVLWRQCPGKRHCWWLPPGPLEFCIFGSLVPSVVVDGDRWGNISEVELVGHWWHGPEKGLGSSLETLRYLCREKLLQTVSLTLGGSLAQCRALPLSLLQALSHAMCLEGTESGDHPKAGACSWIFCLKLRQ